MKEKVRKLQMVERLGARWVFGQVPQQVQCYIHAGKAKLMKSSAAQG